MSIRLLCLLCSARELIDEILSFLCIYRDVVKLKVGNIHRRGGPPLQLGINIFAIARSGRPFSLFLYPSTVL